MRLAFFGPPGGGKGTQAERVKKDAHALPVSTGDLLREHVARKTPLGLKAGDFMGKGGLVPDEIVNEILKERITQPDAREGFILDGYPRTLGQFQSLEALLADLRLPVETWLFIDVSLDAIEERVLNRRVCRKCGFTFNTKTRPSQKGDRCDQPGCDGELYIRPDDNPDKLKKRFAAYQTETVPVIDMLRQKGRLTEVSAGVKSADEVETLVRKALGLKAR
jgi:adenylate kinase